MRRIKRSVNSLNGKLKSISTKIVEVWVEKVDSPQSSFVNKILGGHLLFT